MNYRIERDSIGEREIPADAYYGVQSLRGHENFHITGRPLPTEYIESLAEIKPIRMKVTSDEYSEEGEFVYAGVTNALSVGGMFKFDKNEVSLDDGRFEVLLVRKPINASFYIDMMKMLSKKVYDDKSVVFFRASDIKIECKTPVGWTVDGEYAGDIRSAHIVNIRGGIEIIK